MSKTPMLDYLKRAKTSDDWLVPLVEEWLVENGDVINDYSEAEYEFLKKLLVEGTTRDKSVFSPSGATTCRRAQVIDKIVRPVRMETNPRLLAIFDDGYWRHMRWQMLFNKMGLAESAEQFDSKGDLDYGGSTDLILNIPEHGRVIVDIKGANASRWNNIANSRKPLFAHFIQVQIYMYITGIRTAILWYENKNTNEICEIRVRRDKDVHARAKRRQKFMQRYVEAEAFPREECSVGDDKDSQFTQCRMRSLCQKLPVHLVQKGGVLKIAEPRNPSDLEDLQQYNGLPLTKLRGRRGARSRLSN